ncbi:histidine kinase [Mediterraneibacter sp. NSJ-55]|uniref:Histidine kinase n=1 Tax=Mediterraneibacter hominis TaxID=2763054 RepID=A0A923LJM1_9FIRM|nr:sensor histidine kinase [Mediterraneibacter hominis]MBC5689184.1 histidine kinase [Mediterraneibacter hominis]
MKQKYFINKFIRYFFLFSVPVIIIGLLLTVYSFFQIREDSDRQAQSTFRISSQLMEEILTKGDDIADLMNTNSAISMSMYRILNQNSMDYKENITKNIMFYIFENLKSSSSYVDSVYVYFPNEGDYFFQTNRKLTSIDNSADQQWLNEFKNHTKKDKKWITLRSSQNYYFENSHNVITIYRRIQYYDGVLVINLNQSVLSELLSSLENYPNESIFVTNSNGEILFSNANADKLNLRKEQGIHKQLSLSLSDKGHYLSSVKYNHHTYTVNEFIYPEYNLHFLSLVPSRDIYRLMYNIIYCVIAGIIIAAILCLLFSLYLTQKNFHQIELLMDILWRAEKGILPLDGSGELVDTKKLDEYNLILNRVILTFVENNTLTMQINEWQLKKTISELKALQLQINPHFFFNTLQSIDMEIIKNEGYQAPASRLIHSLSDILRYALGDSRTSVSLRDEIQSCKEYMEIQKFHNPRQIVLLWDYDDALLDYSVIRLLFQPLLENSIHYSIQSPQDTLVIRIKIYDTGNFLRFHILDNGIGIEKKRLKQIRESLHSPEDQEHHIGIKNTHKRLVLTYPDNPGLTIISHLKQGTCISFSIPKHKK